MLLIPIILSTVCLVKSASIDKSLLIRKNIKDDTIIGRQSELRVRRSLNTDAVLEEAETSKKLIKRELTINETYTHDTLPTLWENLDFWMTQLPATIRDVPLVHLAIPGSHNSMTYAIDRNNELGPDNPALVNAANQVFPNLTKVLAYNWAINQKVSAKEQLDGGIRYLDLRLATKKHDDKFYFVHGLYGSVINEPLQEVADWLTEHPNEVIVLDFQHFYNFTENHHRELIYLLKGLFKGKLCPRFNQPKNVTLNWLNEKKYQVLIIYRHFIVTTDDTFWLDRMWPTPWPETVSRTKLVRFLNNGLKNRDRTIGFISQAVLTPDQRYISRNIFGNTEQTLTKKMQRVTIDWVNSHYPGITGGMNIVMTDFVSSTEFLFSKTVIQRNEKFLIDNITS